MARPVVVNVPLTHTAKTVNPARSVRLQHQLHEAKSVKHGASFVVKAQALVLMSKRTDLVSHVLLVRIVGTGKGVYFVATQSLKWTLTFTNFQMVDQAIPH